MNKKGIELAWSTIVTMVLALAILIVLIMFFTGGASNLFDKMKVYFSESNLDSMVQGCNILVDAGSEHSYCCEPKEIKYFSGGVRKKASFSCGELFKQNFTGDNIKFLDCKGVIC